MTRLSGRVLLLALPLSLGCSVDASGLSEDDASGLIDAADDTTSVDAVFEVAPPDDTGQPETTPPDAPIFESPDAGCFDPSKDCPPPPACNVAACVGGSCTLSPQAQRTSCSSGGGRLCDSAGTCVACLLDGDCTNPATPNCVAKQCVAPACMNGKKDPGETDVDCGGPCAKCGLGLACVGGGDCASGSCIGKICACTADAQCGGKFCELATGQCKNHIVTGRACTRPGECSSGFCVDGVCCNAACNGTCVACLASKQKPGGMDGTCSQAKDGTDPHSTCAAAPPCGFNGQCMAGACQFFPPSTSCAPASCSGSTLTSARTCDGAGACGAGVSAGCAPYLCDTAMPKCKTTCGSASDCATGAACLGVACVTLKSNGATCVTGTECASNNCASGVCCDTGCGSKCMGCAVAPMIGTCSDLPVNAPDLVHGCSITQACNGSGTCLLASGQSCMADTECASSKCNIAGGSGKGSCN